MSAVPTRRAHATSTPPLGPPRRRYLNTRRAGRNLQRAARSLHQGNYGSVALFGAVATAEIAAWALARVAGAALTTAGLIVITVGLAARAAAFARHVDDDRRLAPDQAVDLWSRGLLVIPWALGLVSVDHTVLAAAPAPAHLAGANGQRGRPQ